MSNSDQSAGTTPILSGRAYKILKPVATTILPGASALYLSLALVWGFPYPDKVGATIAAVNVFLGLLLGLSTRAYNRSDQKYDGQIDIMEKPDGVTRYSIGVKDDDPEAIKEKDQILLRVNKSTNSNIAR